MNKAILDALICPICLEYSTDAVNSSCCQALLCKKCTSSFEYCPICRTKCHFNYSIFASRLIKMIETNCDLCGYKCTRGDIEEHKTKCDQALIKCNFNSCNQNIAKIDYFNHLITYHSKEVNDKMSSIIEIFNPMDQTASNDSINLFNENKISIEPKLNNRDFSAKLGATGKYYCGKKLDGPRCYCCDGYCGTRVGCNCSACMELDIKSRNLPNGWLVNKEGFSARKSDGKFYCGRLVLQKIALCDGYCKPIKESQCNSCRLLDLMTEKNSRYCNLIKEESSVK